MHDTQDIEISKETRKKWEKNVEAMMFIAALET